MQICGTKVFLLKRKLLEGPSSGNILGANMRISCFPSWVVEEETFDDLNICGTDYKDGRLNYMGIS